MISSLKIENHGEQPLKYYLVYHNKFGKKILMNYKH